jgi:hypothetical protein
MFRSPQVILFSTGVPRAAAFYRRVGCTEAFRVPAEGNPSTSTALAAPHGWLGRLLIAWTADPDGNPIQIVQPVRSPPGTAAPAR